MDFSSAFPPEDFNKRVVIVDVFGNPIQLGGVVPISLPPELLTGDGESPRLRVDPGQTGFFKGEMFRIFHEIDIPQGSSTFLRFVCPHNFILWGEKADLDAGAVRVENIIGGEPSGPWTNVPVFPRNSMTEVPSPAPVNGMVVSVGGTVTGGVVADLMRIRTAANQGNSHSSNVGDQQSDERGLPPGTYFIKISPLPGVAETTTGVIRMSWEERPIAS